MNIEALVEALLEADDLQRADLIDRLKAEGYDFVDATKLGDYDLMLWKGHKERNGRPVEFYEVSLNHKGAAFDTEQAQMGKQPGASMDLLGRKQQMTGKLDQWLERAGTLYIGSFDPRKLSVYRRVIKKYMPHLRVSEPFKGFDDSVRPDYFTITGRQPQFQFGA